MGIISVRLASIFPLFVFSVSGVAWANSSGVQMLPPTVLGSDGLSTTVCSGGNSLLSYSGAAAPGTSAINCSPVTTDGSGDIETAGKVDASKYCVNGENCGAPVPSGAVMMFNLATCPTGWSSMPALSGRVIVASGSYSETSPGSTPTPFSQTYNLGDSGGAAFYSLTLTQMPKHTHLARLTGTADDAALSSLWANDYLRQGYIEFDWTGLAAGAGSAPEQTPASSMYGHSLIGADGDGLGPFISNGYAGGDANSSPGQASPVDNRMPYYVLTFCQKD